MDKEKAERIYWVIMHYENFYNQFDQNRNDYDEVKKQRVKIANRYRELKSTHDFGDSLRIASTEWLMEYLNDNS